MTDALARTVSTKSRKRARETPGARARLLRKAKGLTIAEAADEAGMGASALCDFENGKRDLRLSSLLRLARFLGVPPSSLIDA
jgi:transcriptional regulator with XRE-family HTH domain